MFDNLLNDLINKIDQSVDLYGLLKGIDSAIGGDAIRQELLYELEYWTDAQRAALYAQMVANPAAAAKNLIKNLIEREINGRPAAAPVLPPWDKQKEDAKQPTVQKDPPPYRDNTFTPPSSGGGNKTPAPITPPKSSVTKPPRKLLPPKNPGFTQTEETKPINAKKQIGDKRWGELICYCVVEKGTTATHPNFSAEQAMEKSQRSLDALIGIVFADALPCSLPLKQAVKSKSQWWAASAWVAPSSIQGLRGDVSLVGGIDAIFDIAEAMSVQSFNAYVGFSPELYLETEKIDYAQTLEGTRQYAPLPFLAGHNTLSYEIGTLKDKDMGVFMGIPYDQWLRATPKTGNLQLQFYGKSKPPYSFKGPDGKSVRYRPSEVNIPDPRDGLTWAEIKSVASQYQTGGHCCTIQLECGRPIVAWANSNEAAESRARSLATLSTSPVTGKDPVFTIIKSKKTLTMYPGEAIYTVGGSSGKQKMKLWVDKVEDSGYDDALLKEEDLSTLV
jgi:hypothetical protein